MSNTVANPGPLDPTASCKPDEPIFPLVGHDPDAPATVRFWADHRRARIMREINDLSPGEMMSEAQREDLRRCTEADFIAVDMDLWLKGKKQEDALKGTRLMHGVDEKPEDSADTERREVIADAVSHLREAAYYASEARSGLEGIGDLHELELEDLANAIATINRLAETKTLKRVIPAKEKEEIIPANA